MNANQEILSYARGNVSAGVAVDVAAKAHMAKTGEKSYSAAIKAVIKEAKATAAWDRRDFIRLTRNYATQRGISGSEAARAVAEGDPRMKSVFVNDPMAASEIAGISEPRPKADITVPTWTPPEHESIAINQVAAILFNLPRDGAGFVSLAQCAAALKDYPDILQRAAGDKVDFYTRSEISIQGMPGIVSKNYPVAFEAARRRFPSLFALYSTGRLTSQSLRELLPQLKITD